MTTKIKICGIKDVGTALAAAKYGADMLGLVFAASRRRIELQVAREIRRQLPKSMLVGVFKDQTLAEILELSSQAGLDLVQLHGEEAPELLADIKLPVLRTVSVQQDGSCQFAFQRWRGVQAFLLDSALPDGSSGGAGKVFAWENFDKTQVSAPLIVAGGLNLENVTQAISILKPYAVDVSGGVEVQGEKSPELIKKFIAKVKGMDNA